jgi:hypothetical protein
MNTNNIFFNLCHPILSKLSDGHMIKLGFRFFLGLFAVLSLLGGIYFGYQPLDIAVNIWSILFFLSSTFTGWMVFQICWFRAGTIKETPDSRFVVSAIFSVFIRTIGEITATICTVIGVMGGLIALFSDFGRMIPGGPIAIIAGPVVGFLIISFFYFIAERLSALPEIAVNTKK